MSDQFVDNPAGNAVAVTPSDSTPLQFNALYVGGYGTVVVTTLSGAVVSFVGAQEGSILPVRGTRVMAATTATNILALS